MDGFVQISFGWIDSILVPYFRHIILVILRLNEGGFFFSFGGVWWHCLVHVTVKGGPLFFLLGLFSFVFYLTGRLVLRHIGVFGSIFLCFFFHLFCCPQRPGVIFFLFPFGVWPWDSLCSSEKKPLSDLFVVFYCLL